LKKNTPSNVLLQKNYNTSFIFIWGRGRRTAGKIVGDEEGKTAQDSELCIQFKSALKTYFIYNQERRDKGNKVLHGGGRRRINPKNEEDLAR